VSLSVFCLEICVFSLWLMGATTISVCSVQLHISSVLPVFVTISDFSACELRISASIISLHVLFVDKCVFYLVLVLRVPMVYFRGSIWPWPCLGIGWERPLLGRATESVADPVNSVQRRVIFCIEGGHYTGGGRELIPAGRRTADLHTFVSVLSRVVSRLVRIALPLRWLLVFNKIHGNREGCTSGDHERGLLAPSCRCLTPGPGWRFSDQINKMHDTARVEKN